MAAPGVLVKGALKRRPGVYGQIDATALARARSLPAGVVAVIGAFDRLQPKTVVEIGSADELRAALPLLGRRLARLLYEPDRDSRITGAPSAVLLVRADPATRAQATVLDTNAAASIIFKAPTWGSYGNGLSVKQENGTNVGKKITVQAGVNPARVLDDIYRQAFSLNHPDTTELASLTLEVSPISGGYVRVVYGTVAFALNTDPKTITPTKLAFDGTVTLTLDQVPGGTVTVVFTGRRKSDGALVSDTRTITAAATSCTSLIEFSDLTNVVVSNKGSATTATLSGRSFDIAVTSNTTINDVLTKINAYASRGYTTVRLTGANLKIVDLDKLTATSAQNLATATVGAMLYETVARVNADGTLVAERASSVAPLPPVNFGLVFLGGGAEGSPVTADWNDCFTALRAVRCDLVVALTSDADVVAAGRAHCDYMEGDGADERMFFSGQPTDSGLDAIRTAIINTNNRNVATFGQEINVDADSGREWLEPYYQAVQAVGLHACKEPRIPVTEKIVNVYDIRNATSWDADRDAEKVIERGLCAYYKDKDGFFRVLRAVTTYQQDENSVYTLISRNYTANRAVKRLRAVMQLYIGTDDVEITTDFLRDIANREMDYMVTAGQLKEFQPEATAFVPLGNGIGYNAVFKFAVPSSNDFITFKAVIYEPTT